ncbi:MAG: hypothetical protein AAFY81_04780, partial [Pseudomonadota bacterium]
RHYERRNATVFSQLSASACETAFASGEMGPSQQANRGDAMKQVVMALSVLAAISVSACSYFDPCEQWKDEVRDLGRMQVLLEADYPMTYRTFQSCMREASNPDQAAQTAVCFSAVALMANDCTFNCARSGGGTTSFDDFSQRILRIEQRARQLAKTRPEQCQTR